MCLQQALHVFQPTYQEVKANTLYLLLSVIPFRTFFSFKQAIYTFTVHFSSQACLLSSKKDYTKVKTKLQIQIVPSAMYVELNVIFRSLAYVIWHE